MQVLRARPSAPEPVKTLPKTLQPHSDWAKAEGRRVQFLVQHGCTTAAGRGSHLSSESSSASFCCISDLFM